MTIDIEAIRRKLNAINSGFGDRKQFKRWKYSEAKKYRLRVLPWRDAEPGMPFPQKIVYYGIGPKSGTLIVSPENVGEPCPIKEFRIQLFNEAKEKKDESIKEMAKKLNAKTATCVCVIDRDNEAEGPQMWNPSWTDAKQLLGLFLTDGVGDYTDLKHGYDIEVTITPSKKFNPRTKKPLLDARLDAARQSTPACKDDATLSRWLESMPNIDDYFPVTSYADAEKNLKIWMESGGEPAADATNEADGTSRGGPAKSASPEASPSSKSAAKKAPSEKVATGGKQAAAKKPILQQAEDDLDEALAELEKSDG